MTAPMLSMRQAEARLGIERGYIVRLVYGGELPGYRLPGTNGGWRFKVADVDAFIEAHRVDPATFPGREARIARRLDHVRRGVEDRERRRAAR